MAEASIPSTPTGKKSTGKTEQPAPDLGPEEALQILNRAIRICRDANLPVFQTPIYAGGEEVAGLIIHQAVWEGSHLKYTGKSTGKAAESTGGEDTPGK